MSYPEKGATYKHQPAWMDRAKKAEGMADGGSKKFNVSGINNLSAADWNTGGKQSGAWGNQKANWPSFDNPPANPTSSFSGSAMPSGATETPHQKPPSFNAVFDETPGHPISSGNIGGEGED